MGVGRAINEIHHSLAKEFLADGIEIVYNLLVDRL